MSYQEKVNECLKRFPELIDHYKKRIEEIQPEPVKTSSMIIKARTVADAYEDGIKRILRYGHVKPTEEPYFNLRCEIENLIFDVENVLVDRLSPLYPLAEGAVLERYAPEVIDGSVPSLDELPEKVLKKELYVYMYAQRAQNYFWDSAERVTDLGLELIKEKENQIVKEKARVLFDGKSSVEKTNSEILVHMGYGINQEELLLKHLTEDFPFSNRTVEILFNPIQDHCIADEIFGEKKRTAIPCLDIRQTFLRKWYNPEKDSLENLFEGPWRLDFFVFYRSRDHFNAWNGNVYGNTVQQIIRAKMLTDMFQTKKHVIIWRGKKISLENIEVIPGHYIDLSGSDHIYHTDWKLAAEKVGMDLDEERPDLVRFLKEIEKY